MSRPQAPRPVIGLLWAWLLGAPFWVAMVLVHECAQHAVGLR